MNGTVATVSHVKQRNITLVKRALRALPVGTKQSVASVTGLSITTCNSILNELHDKTEVLLVDDDSNAGVGRPAKTYKFNKDYEYVCCIYPFKNHRNGNNHFRYAILDLLGNIIEEDEVLCSEITYSELEKLLRKLTSREPRKIRTICFGTAGYYNNGALTGVCEYPDLNGVDIVHSLTENLGCRVILENDMNAIAYGMYQEEHANNVNASSLVVVAFFDESGVGSGIVIDGKIHHGDRNFAGEVIYLPFPDGDVRASIKQGRDRIIGCAALIVQCFTAIINPTLCILTGEYITRDMVEPIAAICGQRIPEEKIPIIRYHQEYSKYYINGLYNIALETIMQA